MKIRTYGLQVKISPRWQTKCTYRGKCQMEQNIRSNFWLSKFTFYTKVWKYRPPPFSNPTPFFCINTISTLFIYWTARDILSVKYRSIKCVWESWSFVSKFCLSETFMFNYGSVTNRASSIVFSFALPCDIISTFTLIWTIIIVITSRTLRKNCH